MESDNTAQITMDEPDRITSPSTFEEACYDVARDIASLVISKQRDYGHGNILKFGEQGLKVRMSDKMERIINMMETGDPAQNESLLDSFTDMAGYGIIDLMLNRGTFTLKLKKDQSTVAGGEHISD